MISCDQGSRVAKTHMRSDNFRCHHSHVRHGLVCLFVNKNRLFLESLSRSQACAHIYTPTKNPPNPVNFLIEIRSPPTMQRNALAGFHIILLSLLSTYYINNMSIRPLISIDPGLRICRLFHLSEFQVYSNFLGSKLRVSTP